MKELTKEDKARRYDEVINRMKHYVVDEYGCSRIKVADVFPELSESEDEKIRKALMSILKSDFEKDTTIFGISVGQILAWLEKQSERKSTDKIQIGKEYKCIASPRYSTFMTGKIYKPEDKFLCRFMNFCSDCFEPIEDSEQIDLTSNTDKVESKFKVGDWVVTSYGEVSQVISVDKDYEGYTLDNDNYFSGTWCDMYHLWTIDDAKNGDVLVDCNKDEEILMFRGIGNAEWDDVIDYHCYYSCFRKAFCVQKGVEHWGDTNDHKLKPATKEQRELFFSKMKEAGYKWDSEKKQVITLNHFEDNNDMVEAKFKSGDIIHCKLDNRTFIIKEVDLKKGVYIYTEKGCGNDINYADEMFELVEPNPYTGTSFVYNNHTWGMCARDGGVDILCDSKLIKHIGEQKPDERKEFVLVSFGTDIKLEDDTIIIPDGYAATIDGNKIYIKKEDKGTVEAIKEEKVENAIKAEPIFKVGEWIIQENIGVYEVVEICESWYEVIDVENNHYSIGFDKEYMCHLWSIEDAKDGDVLMSSVNKPFIYNGYFDKECVGAYCGLYINDDFVIADKERYWTNNKNIRPASKEQRDLLFQKMKEAGYENVKQIL